MAYAEPGRFAAGTLALLVHAAFFTLLVFTVSWQSHAPQPIAVELWSSLPPLPQPRVQPQQRPEPKPEPVPEKAAPPKPKIELAKPDIAIKEKKLEKQREEKHKQDEDKRKAEQVKLKQQALKDKQERLAESHRQEEQQALMRNMQAREAAAQARQVNDYTARINAKIKRNINNQACLTLSNPKVAYDVTLMPTGQLLMEPRLAISSGAAQCDQAIERAIRRAEPLPLPPDTALFSQFRELHLEFRPNDEN
jgi:colicin import membrane protein